MLLAESGRSRGLTLGGDHGINHRERALDVILLHLGLALRISDSLLLLHGLQLLLESLLLLNEEPLIEFL